MANGGDPMDGDLEDGEISSSESEMGTAASTQTPVAPVFGGQSFQSRAAAQACAANAYRSTCRTVDSSDSDQDSSDEEAALWRRKRQKVSNAPAPAACTVRPGSNALAAPSVLQGRKVNNIWGSVVQEQCQDAITSELGIFGMESEFSMASRDVETYNYVLARKMMAKERNTEKEAKDEEYSILDAQLEDYMRGHGSEERAGGDCKRKRPVKDRLGPKSEMDIKGRYEITEDDPEDKVADEIAHRLQEPKKDLIERVVNVIGTKKAIELLGETASLEEGGGMYTMDGSRRRTPGGVYLNLLKNTPSITKAQIKKIFLDEQQKEYKSKKAAQKRRRHVVAKKMKQAIGTLNLHEHDDVSRETFASDTNEALESLEEAAQEGEDGQETAVVYNSADLEVF